MKEKIGIMGGSFDPVHLGHLIISQHVKNSLKFSKVILLPTGKAPHKTYNTKREDRLRMLEIATESNPDFFIEDYEIKNTEIVYTIDSLKYLKSKYPDATLYFIIGLDNLYDLKNWKDISQYYKYADFVVTKRVAKIPIEIEKKISFYENEYKLKIHFIKSPIIEISSSNIRKNIRDNNSINYLTKDEVVDYIYQRNLYK